MYSESNKHTTINNTDPPDKEPQPLTKNDTLSSQVIYPSKPKSRSFKPRPQVVVKSSSAQTVSQSAGRNDSLHKGSQTGTKTSFTFSGSEKKNDLQKKGVSEGKSRKFNQKKLVEKDLLNEDLRTKNKKMPSKTNKKNGSFRDTSKQIQTDLISPKSKPNKGLDKETIIPISMISNQSKITQKSKSETLYKKTPKEPEQLDSNEQKTKRAGIIQISPGINRSKQNTLSRSNAIPPGNFNKTLLSLTANRSVSTNINNTAKNLKSTSIIPNSSFNRNNSSSLDNLTSSKPNEQPKMPQVQVEKRTRSIIPIEKLEPDRSVIQKMDDSTTQRIKTVRYKLDCLDKIYEKTRDYKAFSVSSKPFKENMNSIQKLGEEISVLYGFDHNISFLNIIRKHLFCELKGDSATSRSDLWTETLLLGAELQCLYLKALKEIPQIAIRELRLGTEMWKYSVYYVIEKFRLGHNTFGNGFMKENVGKPKVPTPDFHNNGDLFDSLQYEFTEMGVESTIPKEDGIHDFWCDIERTFFEYLLFSTNVYQMAFSTTKDLMDKIMAKTLVAENDLVQGYFALQVRESESLGNLYRYMWMYSEFQNLSGNENNKISLKMNNQDHLKLEYLLNSLKWYITGVKLSPHSGKLYYNISNLCWNADSQVRAIWYSFMGLSATSPFDEGREGLLPYLESVKDSAISIFGNLDSWVLIEDEKSSSNRKKIQGKQSSNGGFRGANRKSFANNRERKKNSEDCVPEILLKLGLCPSKKKIKGKYTTEFSCVGKCITDKPESDELIPNSLGGQKKPIECFGCKNGSTSVLQRLLFLVWLKLHHKFFTKARIDEFDLWLERVYKPLFWFFIEHNVKHGGFRKDKVFEPGMIDLKDLMNKENVDILSKIDFNGDVFRKTNSFFFDSGYYMTVSDMTALHSYGRKTLVVDETPYEVLCVAKLVISDMCTILQVYESKMEVLDSIGDWRMLGPEDRSDAVSFVMQKMISFFSASYFKSIFVYLLNPLFLDKHFIQEHIGFDEKSNTDSEIGYTERLDELFSRSENARIGIFLKQLVDSEFIPGLCLLLNSFRTKLRFGVSSRKTAMEVLRGLEVSSDLGYKGIKQNTASLKYCIFSYKSGGDESKQSDDEIVEILVNLVKESKEEDRIYLLNLVRLYCFGILLVENKMVPIYLDNISDSFFVVERREISNRGESSSEKTNYGSGEDFGGHQIKESYVSETDDESMAEARKKIDYVIGETEKLYIEKTKDLKKEQMMLQNQLEEVSRNSSKREWGFGVSTNKLLASRSANFGDRFLQEKAKSSETKKISRLGSVNRIPKVNSVEGAWDSMLPGKTAFVFDTNCYIVSLGKIKEFCECTEFEVIVPLSVVMELNGLRANRTKLGTTATEAVGFIREKLEEWKKAMNVNVTKAGNSQAGKQKLKVVTMKGNFLRDLTYNNESFYDDDENSWISAIPSQSVDDVILTTCINLSKLHEFSGGLIGDFEKGKRLVLVTGDRNLRIKAFMAGIQVVPFAPFKNWASSRERRELGSELD
ncbi:hypothetical protein BB558_004293 [Smittium angustum]|uniref:PIN domain-containing protein n=1 Tax=Smittium angustum TaxID=133377 RepID=A0A2U1J3N5_SMIAN|nr:hypothetical protein BB558_004293 [Smittium angustum]